MMPHSKLRSAAIAAGDLGNALEIMALHTDEAQKIDWTNLRKLIGTLLRQLLPIFLPLILDLLDPQPPPS